MEYASSTSPSDWLDEIGTVAAQIVHREEAENTHESCRPWAHGMNRKREELSELHKWVRELRKYPCRLHVYFKMSTEKFDYLQKLFFFVVSP